MIFIITGYDCWPNALSLDANTLRTVARPGMRSAKQAHGLLLATVLMLLAISAIRPHDYFTWFLEVAPVLIGVPLLIWTYRTISVSQLCFTPCFLFMR